MTAEPCPRCLPLVIDGRIRRETLQPLRGGALDPHAVDGSGPCCRDCAAADTLLRLGYGHPDWDANRIVTGNDRQEQLRLPGAPMGLVYSGIMTPSEPGELESHNAWLNEVVPLCSGCNNLIDAEVCYCGTELKHHGDVWSEGHPFVPMGCDCLRAKEELE